MRINKITQNINNKQPVNFSAYSNKPIAYNSEFIGRMQFSKMNDRQRMNAYLHGVPMYISDKEQEEIERNISAWDFLMEKSLLNKEYHVYRRINEQLINKVLGDKELADYMGKVSYINPSKKDIDYVKNKLIGKTFKETGFMYCNAIIETNEKDEDTEIIVNRNYWQKITDVNLGKDNNKKPVWILKTEIVDLDQINS